MERKRKILIWSASILCGLILGPPAAQATLITINIEGMVDLVGDPHGYLGGTISIGDAIMGTYTYDSDTPDQDWLWGSPSDIVGRYHYFSPPYGITLRVGDFVFQTDPSNTEFLLSVVNNNQSGEDIYCLNSYNNLPLSDGTFVGGISWEIRDYTGTAFSSDALPANAPVLDDWQFNRLDFGGGVLGQAFGVIGHITSATVIPEPATVILLGMGGFLLIRKRPKRN